MDSLDDLDALGDFDADELAAPTQSSSQGRAEETQASEAVSALDELDDLGTLEDAEIDAAIQNSQSEADEGASATEAQAPGMDAASAPAAAPAEPVSDAPMEEELSFAELRRRAEAEEVEEEADVADGSAGTGTAANDQLDESMDTTVDPLAQAPSPAAVEEAAGERPLTMAELRRKADEEEEAELAAKTAADAEVAAAEAEAEAEAAEPEAKAETEQAAAAADAPGADGSVAVVAAAEAAETVAQAVAESALPADADASVAQPSEADAGMIGEAMIEEEPSPHAPIQDEPQKPQVSPPGGELATPCGEPAADDDESAVEPEGGDKIPASAGTQAAAEPKPCVSPDASAAVATPGHEATGYNEHQVPMEVESGPVVNEGDLESEMPDAAPAQPPNDEPADVATEPVEDEMMLEPEEPTAKEAGESVESPVANGASADPAAAAPPSPVPSSTGVADTAAHVGHAPDASPAISAEETPSPRLKRVREDAPGAGSKAARPEACDAETKQEKPKTAVPTEAESPDPRAQLFGGQEERGTAGAETLSKKGTAAGSAAQAAAGGDAATAMPGPSSSIPSSSKAPASSAEVLNDKIKKVVKGYVQRAKTHKRTFGDLLDHLEESLGIEARGERKETIYGMAVSAMKQRRTAKTAA